MNTSSDAVAQGIFVRKYGGPWGRWWLSERKTSLEYCRAGQTSYFILLSELQCASDICGWLDHISTKTWLRAEDMGQLVRAIRDTAGLR